MSRRWLRAIAVGDIIALAAGVGLVFLRSERPVSVDEAVKRFRATRAIDVDATVATVPRTDRHPSVQVRVRTRARPPAAAERAQPPRRQATTVPEPGVYVYATSGWEQVDIPGGRHEYPASTSITVRHAGCGLVTRWDALVERWDERETCPSGAGERLRSLTSYHEFFRHGERVTYQCLPPALARPAGAAVGDRWDGTCETDDSAATFRGVVIGREHLRVDGKKIETLHIRVETSITGGTTGTNVHDDWLLPDTGLVVREISTTTARVRGPFGTVRYEESYELKLSSLEPRA